MFNYSNTDAMDNHVNAYEVNCLFLYREFLFIFFFIRFALLLINQLGSGLTACTFSLTFILMLELTSSAHTSLAGNSALISFTIGELILILFAYAGKD
jgi:hypothetical protein